MTVCETLLKTIKPVLQYFSMSPFSSFPQRPSTNAIMALTFSSYVLQPFFAAECEVPKIAQQLLAAATICKLINFYDVLIIFFSCSLCCYNRE